VLIGRLRSLPAARFSTPDLATIKVVAFAGPVAFAIGLGAVTTFVLEPTLPQFAAHVAASAIVAVAALIFTLWIFGVLATLHERLDRMARLEERQRIALRLHDEVIQSAYGVQLALQLSLDRLSEDGQEHARDGLNQAIDHLDGIVVSVRKHILYEDDPDDPSLWKPE